jgi:hypothetical protein
VVGGEEAFLLSLLMPKRRRSKCLFFNKVSWKKKLIDVVSSLLYSPRKKSPVKVSKVLVRGIS